MAKTSLGEMKAGWPAFISPKRLSPQVFLLLDFRFQR
jgi:hypothetical protein